MAMNRKGVLFTLGVTLLVAAVFALAVLIFHNYKVSEERVSDILLVERVSNLFSSIERSLSALYYNTSSIDIRSNTTRLILYPFDFRYQNSFKAYASSLELNVETNYPMVNITNNFGTSNFGFFVIDQNGAEVTNYTVNISTYSAATATLPSSISRLVVYYYSASQNGSAQWTSVSPGSLNVTIIAEGNGSWRSVAGAMVDPIAISYGRITGLNGGFNVTVGQELLDVQTNNTELSNVYTSLYYSPREVRVYIPAIISVDIDGKASRTQKSRIL